MGKKLAAFALLGLAAFMLIGFLGSDSPAGGGARIAAFVIAVVLPAAFGIAMLRSAPRGNAVRMQQLRQQTIDSEILRLAIAHQGQLTAVEISSALGLPEPDVQRSLEEMVRREVADMDVTDDGVLVYTFHDAKHLGGTREPKGFLDG
jgi:hypothetical protein